MNPNRGAGVAVDDGQCAFVSLDRETSPLFADKLYSCQVHSQILKDNLLPIQRSFRGSFKAQGLRRRRRRQKKKKLNVDFVFSSICPRSHSKDDKEDEKCPAFG